MQDKWAEEEAAAVERFSKARLSEAGKEEQGMKKTSKNIRDWTTKSRYMREAVHSATRSLQSTTAREVRPLGLWRMTLLLQQQAPRQHIKCKQISSQPVRAANRVHNCFDDTISVKIHHGGTATWWE